MSDFTSDVLTSSVTDLSKRVRYSTGLVLGVDEFNQDQAYFIERDRLLTRALHGYGVVQGLRVHVDTSDDLPQLRVGPGLAVDPCGQHMCVDQAQCAVIDDWLARQTAEVLIGDESEPAEICLSIVLRYGTCATDFVPIPGEPCRSAEEACTASRLADDFSLALEPETDRPPQVEEGAIRLLGRLLRALEVRPTDPYISEGDLRSLVRAVPETVVSVDENDNVFLSDDLSLTALAEKAGVTGAEGVTLPETEDDEPLLRVEPGQEAEMLRALEIAWVTHARRELLRTGHGDDPLDVGGCGDGTCQPVPSDDDGVVLGTLCFEVESDGNGGVERTTDEETLEVRTDDRPLLLASRVLQETGIFDRVRPGEDGDGGFEGTSAGGDLTGTYPDPQVAGLRDEPLSMEPSGDPDLADGQVLTYDGSTWRPEPLPEPEPSPEPEPVPTNAEPDLTRIIALSWEHQIVYFELEELLLNIDAEEVEREEALGLAVAFGAQPVPEGLEVLTVEEGRAVRASTLTPETFRVFMEVEGSIPALNNRMRLAPDKVLPLEEMFLDENGLIRGGAGEVQTELARGAVFLFPEFFAELLSEVKVPRLEIEIRGDFIIDGGDKAVDAEFVRAELPTGDRPGGREPGVQGGRFESWIYVGVVDLNSASREELMTLENVGASIARRIIEYREQRDEPITDPLQLREVRGLTEDRIREWEGRVAPPLPS